ncbi:hypothetical protein F4779DRAFT_619485 [Xylariaceae sp. FL0662B]|nr:hypothetical protein F4779DRAFT_619485 [Xylariaceae sp. FL0662B]
MSSHVQRPRPALGERVPFGTLYDARTDKFLPQSLLKREHQFDLMNIDPDLAASILAKLVRLRGAGVFLDDMRQGDDVLHAANLEAFDSECLGKKQATHFVAGIEWGIQSIVSIKHTVSSSEARTAVESCFQTEVAKFKSAVETDASTTSRNNMCDPTNMPLDITTYSDIFTAGGVLMGSLEEARYQLSLVPIHIQREYCNKGQPIMYTLLPIDILGILFEVEGGLGAPMTPVKPETELFITHLFDEFACSQQKLYHHHAYASEHRKYCSKRHRNEIKSRLDELRSSLQRFEKQYAEALVNVRSGKDEASIFKRIHEAYASGESSPADLVDTIDLQLSKTKSVVAATRMGGTYVDSGGSVANLIGDKDAYVFSISEEALKNNETWDENVATFQTLLNNRKPDTLYIIFDCDTVDQVLSSSYISYYEKGKEVSEDIVEQQHWLTKQCFVQYKADTLETQHTQRPLKRRLITMPCPSHYCDRSRVCEWKCSKCHTPVEFGFTDQYIYCDCGRSLYENFSFKCDHQGHGSEFEKYHPQRVLSQLKNLGDSENVNILILGETGVGKSTFINAFVNYLTFETLDEAKVEEQLNWVIPCSFSTQIMDRERPDGIIEQIEIKVGARDDERDGSKGASATQRTAVYPITIGNRVIRLIDTPGIGDTRGIQYDKQNMADILSTLSSYDDLHGILILLKSNNARLTVTFNFCMKELLTHLHRSAANNMAFGFTNTRISNHTPGDTFGPLSTLMGEHSDIGLSLTKNTTYCFDSESFRYLAAFKNGTVMDNEEDFRRSWQHSRKESLRLVEYFKSRTPHRVQSTISLNGARQLITTLTKPMADISAVIKTNIAMSEDKIQEVADTRITGDNLRQRLHLEKIHLRPKILSRPRTVCKDPACIEFKDNGSGEVVTIYKTHCHAVCYLDDVKADQVAHPGLIDCAAFDGNTECRHCGHHWQSHLHVLYELEEYMATVTDTEIERQLQENSNDVMLRETAIKDMHSLIAEYKVEHDIIQQAAAKFGIFLKKYSITPYNDATLEYLEMLIRDEETKVQVGGSRKRLQALLEDRRKHEELVELLTRNMDNKFLSEYQVLNEAGVERLVDQLYKLKHFGENLLAVKDAISTAHKATNRERPHRVYHGRAARYHSKAQQMFGWVYTPAPHTRELPPPRESRLVAKPPTSFFVNIFRFWN